MALGVDLALEARIAAPDPGCDGFPKRRNPLNRRVAAKLAEPLLQDRPEERRNHGSGFAERKIDRFRSGLDPGQKFGEAAEGRGNDGVERGGCSVSLHAKGVSA
jgi:hypothetical protein